jgi:hypothetical protein
MGYCTRYSLTWKEIFTDSREAIGKYIAAQEEMSIALDLDGSCYEVCKWYDHEKDMREMSKKFVGVVFTLHGEGEGRGGDQPDFWNKYFLDGKMQVARCKITYPMFNQRLLI